MHVLQLQKASGYAAVRRGIFFKLKNREHGPSAALRPAGADLLPII